MGQAILIRVEEQSWRERSQGPDAGGPRVPGGQSLDFLSSKQMEPLELFKQGCDTMKVEIQEDYPCGKDKDKLRVKLFMHSPIIFSPHPISQRS